MLWTLCSMPYALCSEEAIDAMLFFQYIARLNIFTK